MKRTKPYYQQLLLGMLIVCLLSSVLSSVVAFYTFSRKIIESTSADNSKNLSIINIEFTSLFDICETVPLEHKAFADVAELCQLHFTENYTTVCTFYDDLQQLWADVDIIFIASETQDYFLGDFGTSSTFYYKIGAGIDESVAAPFLEYNASINRFIATWADGNQYIFTQTPVYNSYNVLVGCVTCGMSLNRFDSIATQYASDNLGTVLLLDQNGALLYSSDIVENYEAFDFAQYITLQNDEIISVVVDGVAYLLCVSPLSDDHYTLVSLVPSQTITGNAFVSILINSLQTLFLCGIMSLIFAYFLSKRLYHPIQSIVDYTKQFSTESELSNDLAYIQSSIEQMDASNQKLNHIIDNSKYILQYRNLCALIYGSSVQAISPEMLSFPHSYFTAVLFRVNFRPALGHEMSSHLTNSNLVSAIDTHLQTMAPNAKTFQTLENDIMLLFNSVTEIITPEYLNMMLLSHLEELLQSDNFAEIQYVNIGVGSTVSKLDLVSTSYADAIYALEYASINHVAPIYPVFFDQLENDSSEHHELQESARAVQALLNERDSARLNIIIDQLQISFQLEKARYSIDEINAFFTQIIFDCNRKLSDTSVKVASAIREKNSVVAILNKPSVEEKCAYLKEYFSELIALATPSNSSSSATEKKVFKACAYIEENYMEDVTLQEVADLVGLNYAYFSNAFKIVKGKKFVEYLNDVRLDHAIDLMEHSKSTLNVISQQCGFLSAQHFGLVFKSRYQMSPGQYRSAHFGNR